MRQPAVESAQAPAELDEQPATSSPPAWPELDEDRARFERPVLVFTFEHVCWALVGVYANREQAHSLGRSTACAE